jgi:hypothetical protein
MSTEELIEHVENPLVRGFLRDNLSQFAKDVQVFSGQILANVPPESKPFIISAGFAFYGTPIVSLVPDLPWERIKAAMAAGVQGVFAAEAGDPSQSEKEVPDALYEAGGRIEIIEQAIAAAFVSICESAQSVMGAILVGGVANLLGKYVALYIAGILDEAIEDDFWPILQIPSAGTAGIKPPT